MYFQFHTASRVLSENPTNDALDLDEFNMKAIFKKSTIFILTTLNQPVHIRCELQLVARSPFVCRRAIYAIFLHVDTCIYISLNMHYCKRSLSAFIVN